MGWGSLPDAAGGGDVGRSDSNTGITWQRVSRGRVALRLSERVDFLLESVRVDQRTQDVVVQVPDPRAIPRRCSSRPLNASSGLLGAPVPKYARIAVLLRHNALPNVASSDRLWLPVRRRRRFTSGGSPMSQPPRHGHQRRGPHRGVPHVLGWPDPIWSASPKGSRTTDPPNCPGVPESRSGFIGGTDPASRLRRS